MATHILKIKNSLPIKDLGEFMYRNKIKENDEIIADRVTFEGLGFIARHVLFILMKECISNNRRDLMLPLLPETKVDTYEFYNNDLFSTALYSETGVTMRYCDLSRDLSKKDSYS